MTYVYLLTSLKYSDRHYTGLTTDLKKRLVKHNEGGVKHTSKYRPWQLELYVAFRCKEKAVAFEKYLKSHSGRAFSKRHF